MARSSVAKEALAYCTSCKLDLNHVVVAMQGDRIAKVECRTCKKTHAFKAPKGVTESSAAKPKKTKKKTTEGDSVLQGSSIEIEWEKLMSAHKDLPIKTYSIKTKFVLGDKVRHPNFGDGIVSRLIYPNKIEALFRTDLKILIHGGS